jgi:hypothetical protein
MYWIYLLRVNSNKWIQYKNTKCWTTELLRHIYLAGNDENCTCQFLKLPNNFHSLHILYIKGALEQKNIVYLLPSLDYSLAKSVALTDKSLRSKTFMISQRINQL